MKPTKCPAREKKNEARKAKKEGRRESENLEILLSANALTSKADILLIFCNWIGRPRSVRPENGLVVSCCS